MKKFKKLTALVLAFAAMTAGTSSMAANALDEAAVLEEAAQFSAQERMMLEEQLAAVASSDTAYYVDYEHYATNVLAPTPHYVAFFNAASLESCYLSFYLNRNIDDNNPLLASNYGSGVSNVTIGSIVENSGNNTADARCYKVQLKISGAVPAGSAVMYYRLSDDLGIVASEKKLDYYTSRSRTTIDRIFPTTGGDVLTKCVIAKGDVNRDGVISSEDGDLILKYVVGLTASSRSDKIDGTYDTRAFELAADVAYDAATQNFKNGDGTVTLSDVVAVSKYLSDH